MKNRTIDGYSLAKLLIFILIFLMVSMLIIFAIIIPNIKDYKVIKKKYRTSKSINNKMLDLLDAREKELKKLRKENLKVFNAFNHSFNEKDFLTHSKKYFITTSLSKTDSTTYNENFIEYDFNVTSNIEAPKNFYNFLESINRYENIIETEFPIIFLSNQDKIYSSFKIKVYELNQSN